MSCLRDTALQELDSVLEPLSAVFMPVALVRCILGDQGAVSGWRQSQWRKNRFKKRLKRGKIGMKYFPISPLTAPGSPRMLADHWCRLIQTYSHRKHNCFRFLPNSAENKLSKLRAVHVLLYTEKIPASTLTLYHSVSSITTTTSFIVFLLVTYTRPNVQVSQCT